MDLRKIDALVAEHLMGWVPSYSGDRDSWTSIKTGYFVRYRETFRPSEDIAAAWEVLEKLRMLEWRLRLSCEGIRWRCHIEFNHGFGLVTEHGHSSESAPLAICLTALNAKGIYALK